jgi:hypothetical protein
MRSNWRGSSKAAISGECRSSGRELGADAHRYARGACCVVGSHGGALAAGELGRADAERSPSVGRIDEEALRRGDAEELAVVDGDGAAREDPALDVALAERLLVVGALFVAVVDLAHGRVAPVDDANARGAVDVRGLADEDVALAALGLAEAEVPEVGRLRVDGLDDVLGASRGDALEALHLLDERGDVLEPRLGDLIAERDQRLFVIHRRRRA